MRKLPLYDVDLSYESGCDIYNMIQWLNTPEGRNKVSEKDFLIVCLGTNDVGRYGVEVTLQRTSEFIRFIRRSFPGIRAIGWLALSPRWKPTRLVSAANIGQMHNLFNEHLQVLSHQLDFDVVDARLGLADMRVEDGLHPSNTTGKWKYEGAIREWFSSRAVALSSLLFQRRRRLPSPTAPTTPTTTTTLQMNNYTYVQRQYQPRPNYNQQQQQQNRTRLVTTFSSNNINSTQPFTVSADRVVAQVNRNSRQHPNFPSRSLITVYPHKLRTKEQFFRDNEPPKEIEKEKDKIFLIANVYYQQRHFEEEGRKWKIYEQVASCKEKNLDKDGDDVRMRDLEEIPQARPFSERYSKLLNMTVSDTDSQSNENSNVEDKDKDKEESSDSNTNSTSSSENSDTEEEENKKRKLQDTSLSPTSKGKTSEKDNILRKKKTKSKKKKKVAIENDPRAPEGSPILLVSENSNKEKTDQIPKKTRADTPVDPKEKRRPWNAHVHVRKPQRVRVQPQEIVNEPNIDSSTELPKTPPGLNDPPPISPRQSTPRTPIPPPQPLVYSPNPITSNMENEKEKENNNENNPPTVAPRIRSTIEIEVQDHQMEEDSIPHSPSVIPKDSEINRINLFDFPVIPIECKFHFKTFHLRASLENIKVHREFLEIKSKQQEKELEELMKQFEGDTHRKIVQFVKNSIEPLIDSLKISNQKRLDNLILDQMKEKALRTIREKSSKDSLGLIERAQQRFERTLELKFQLDKLDRRFNENMPPPALNVMDKLQFRSKELSNEIKGQYSEQWNNILRKTKLDLTSVMRIAKVSEIDKSEKEHIELVEKIPVEIRQAYRDLVHVIEIRNNRKVQKKMNFLERKARGTIEK